MSLPVQNCCRQSFFKILSDFEFGWNRRVAGNGERLGKKEFVEFAKQIHIYGKLYGKKSGLSNFSPALSTFTRQKFRMSGDEQPLIQS